MRIINAKIDLSKLDKTKIFITEKGSQYYSVQVIVNDSENEWGQDVTILEPQTKEQRESKQKKIYLGNGKTVYNSDKQF
jgi:hypothetical protein